MDEEIRPIVDEVVSVCKHLKISSDPLQWSVDDTIKWLVYYIQLLKLNNQILDTFKLNGQSLCMLKIDDFHQVQAVDLYWKLQVWKKCLNFGTANHLNFERETSECDTKSDIKSWNSTESFDLSETINMNWLDEDNYTLTCLDDDLFNNYHSNQCLPSLDDISLPSFYTTSIQSNFKLDSKDKDEIVRLSSDNGCLHSIYDFNYHSSNLDKTNSDTQQQSNNNEIIKQNYYSNNQLDQESTYLTILQPSNTQHSNQQNIQSNYQQNHQQNIDQVSSTTSNQYSQQQQHIQYINQTNTVQSNSLPSVSTLKKNRNLSNLDINSNLNLLNTDLSNQQSTQINQELNNSTNTAIKINNTVNNCLNTVYYQNTEQLQHQTNNYHFNHHLNIQNHHQFINSNNNFTTIDSNHQLNSSSPSSISSSLNSSNSSPLPNSPALSPDNSTNITPNITTATKKQTIVRTNGKHGRNNIQLWQFLKELLNQPNLYENCIKWINRKEGEFRIVNSVLVANLWGKRKNRPKMFQMNYDKLSRSIRQYYKKNIMIKTTKSQRLVYKFVGDYMK